MLHVVLQRLHQSVGIATHLFVVQLIVIGQCFLNTRRAKTRSSNASRARDYFVGLLGDLQRVVGLGLRVEAEHRVVQHDAHAHGMIGRKVVLGELLGVQIAMVGFVVQRLFQVRRGDFDLVPNEVALHALVEGDLLGVIASVRRENIFDDR